MAIIHYKKFFRVKKCKIDDAACAAKFENEAGDRDTLDNFKLPVLIFFLPSSCTLNFLITTPAIVRLCSVTYLLSKAHDRTGFFSQKKLIVAE